jgi:hypothetical protein
MIITSPLSSAFRVLIVMQKNCRFDVFLYIIMYRDICNALHKSMHRNSAKLFQRKIGKLKLNSKKILKKKDFN